MSYGVFRQRPRYHQYRPWRPTVEVAAANPDRRRLLAGFVTFAAAFYAAWEWLLNRGAV